jgi:hypothetical protein
MTNRNLQVEIEQQDIRKFIISNDARCKFYVRCSDKFIVEDSGYIENFKEGDLVLSTDRGFIINDLKTFVMQKNSKASVLI